MDPSNTLPFLFCLLFLLNDLSGGGGVKGETEADTNNLYADGGPVLNLEHEDFYKRVANSDKCWLLLFYLSWCGHCIDYAPHYLSVAHQLKGWSKYAAVSAINCAMKSNVDICRDHGVVGYPTLKYLPSHSKNTTLARTVGEDTMLSNVTLVKYVIEQVKRENPAAVPSVVVQLPDDNDETSKASDLTKSHAAENSNRVLVTRHNSSVLYYEDLVYAVKYSLSVEIGAHKSVSGEALEALKRYLYTLYKYFPDDNQAVSDAVAKLYNLLHSEKSNDIPNKMWTQLLNESKVLKSTEGLTQLVRCRGSQTRYRGYPCTLWSLFHTLTMHAATASSTNSEDKGKRDETLCYNTLISIRDYISHFFTCADCREHFSLMAKEISGLKSKTNKDCVLWLWNAHNRVNKRLAGDLSEDPLHPKTQFPNSELCPFCRTPKGMWHEETVYDLLHSTYTSVRHLNSARLLPRKAARSSQTIQVERSGGTYKRGWNPASLTSIEISMCYVLYLVSAIIIALLFYFIAVRQKLFLRARKCPKMNDRYALQYSKPIY